MTTKIRERILDADGKLVVQETHDYTPVVEKAKALKSAGKTDFGESKLVGLVPLKEWHQWAKKHGVNPGDTDAMREIVARELMNRDNAQFRVWEGRF